jgi:hypothetical protein
MSSNDGISKLYISLYVYHGHSIGMFLYDYIIRNVCKFFAYWNWHSLVGVALGFICIAASIFSIIVLFRYNTYRNLIINLVLIAIIFVFKLTVGSYNLHKNKARHLFPYAAESHKEDVIIFGIQLLLVILGFLISLKVMCTKK